MENNYQDGPTIIVEFRCNGCSHLVTEDWVFYEENDGVDRGTDARCKLAEQHIASYWHSTNPTPKWCPKLKEDY